jgi:hypothetical protein
MKVAVMPRQGGWHIDPKRPGHYLRVSGHPDAGVVVLSVWRGEHCVVTHELPATDVPELLALLARAVMPPGPAAQTGLPGAVAS